MTIKLLNLTKRERRVLNRLLKAAEEGLNPPTDDFPVFGDVGETKGPSIPESQPQKS